MMVVDLTLKRVRVSSASWTISRLPRSQSLRSSWGFTPATSLAPRRGYAGSAARPASHVFCYAADETAALGFRLVPVLAAIVLYRFERFPFV